MTSRNDWISREIEREELEKQPEPKATCVVCDRRVMTRTEAEVCGLICPPCQQRVKREGEVQVPCTDWRILYNG